MGEITTGARAVLSRPAAYLSLQRALGSDRSHRRFVAEHVRARPGDRVLDLGCGPGHVLAVLADVDYLGIDLNPDYVRAAREQHGDRGRFRCADLRNGGLDGEEPFDVVVAMGLLHHLDDAAAAGLLASVRRALRSGGRLVTIDPAFQDGQPRLARWLIAMDRGQNVRTPVRLKALVGQAFDDVDVIVRGDLLRVPYTHAIVEATAR